MTPRRGSVRTIVRTRGVPAGIFASIAVLAAADVFTAYMPVVGAESDIGPRAIGVLLALRAAASIAARVGIGATVRRIGRRRLITIGAVAAAAALVGMTVTDEVWVLAILSIVAGFGMGFGQPLSMTLVVQLVPEHAKSTALAVRLTGNRVGQVATPSAAGLIAGNAGASPVFWLLGGILAASALAIQRSTPDGGGPQEPVP
jgi:MFS family permease